MTIKEKYKIYNDTNLIGWQYALTDYRLLPIRIFITVFVIPANMDGLDVLMSPGGKG